jgi:hypothetical protein
MAVGDDAETALTSNDFTWRSNCSDFDSIGFPQLSGTFVGRRENLEGANHVEFANGRDAQQNNP